MFVCGQTKIKTYKMTSKGAMQPYNMSLYQAELRVDTNFQKTV